MKGTGVSPEDCRYLEISEGKNLTDPLIKYIAEECYCIDPQSSTRLDICKLGNDAGIIGAASLYTL